MPTPKSETTKINTQTDGLVNQFGIVCPSCRGSGEQWIVCRWDNCQRCDGYRYTLRFLPRVKEACHAD